VKRKKKNAEREEKFSGVHFFIVRREAMLSIDFCSYLKGFVEKCFCLKFARKFFLKVCG